jgi:hypothetical protein
MNIMDPLPLVLRELYVAGRRPATFRLRMAFGAGGMGFTIWAFLVWGSAHGNGRWIYDTLLLLAASLAIATGLLVAADTVSRERREGTLGFLFLTDLRPADVILGKFSAAALIPATTLLAFFPGLALCQLLGGVGAWEFWRGILALVVTLFFALCATVFVSTHCEDHRRAHAGAGLLLLVLNPIWLCLLSLEVTYRQVPLLYWLVLPVFLALGAVFLNSACNALALGWHDTAIKWERRESLTPAAASLANSFKQTQPLAWMLLRRRPWSRLAWWALGVPALLATLLLFLVSGHAYRPLSMLLLFSAHLSVYLMALTRTAYSFYTDRQDGSLELLLSTRLSMQEMFAAFTRCLLQQTKPLLVVLTLIDLVWSLYFGIEGTTWFILPPAMAATLWVSVAGLGSTGVYRSLLSNHPAFAMIATVLRLSFFPTVISFLGFFGSTTSVLQIALFWVISSGFAALFFGLDARAALEKHGRELLLRPFSEKPPHIDNEWSFIDWDEEVEPRPSFATASAQT